jgi:ArsR family transcriptional regulator
MTDAAVVRRAHDVALPADVVGTLAAIFAALGEPTRLRIVHALSVGELCVGDLATVLGMAVPAVSQHLRVLRDLRIVRNRRVGKMVYYALDDAHVADLFAVALAHVHGEKG